MRKYSFLLILLLSFMSLSCLSSSCSNEDASQEIITEEPKEEVKQMEIKEEYFQDSFIDPDDFFNLNYTPYLPEEFSKNLNRDLVKNNKEDYNNPAVVKKTESIVPGLRNISEYKTSYNTNKAIAADKFYKDTITGEIAANGKVKPSNDAPLTVITWGPAKTIPAAIRQPEFFVMFSEPVVPIAALGSEMKSSDIIKISPEIEGVYRWNGTNLLSFIPSKPIKPQKSYKIEVSDSLTSLSGKKITGERTFNTTSEKLKIIWSNPGYKYREKHFSYFSQDDVPPEAAKEFRVQFNYMVNAEDIAKDSVITVGDKKISNFTVNQETSDTVTYYINTDIPTETKITLKVAGTAEVFYSSVSKFRYKYHSSGGSYGSFSNPVYIDFSHPLDQVSVMENISTSLDYKLTEDNIKINEASVMIYNLPVTFKSVYTVILGKDIKDIYGRTLGETVKIDIEVPDAESMINFTDYGSKILEASYPHVMVFEHQNLLEGSFYSLNKTGNPLDIKSPDWTKFGTKKEDIKIVSEPKNQRILEKVELDPYLTNGRGMVRFEALAKLPIKRNGKEIDTYTRSNVTTVQVTDLGVTARLGVNKSVVLVTNISDGRPVENAKVYLYNGRQYSIPEVLDAEKNNTNNDVYLGTNTTNKDGVTIISYDIKEAAKWFNNLNNSYFSPAILVVTENDAVTYCPSSHSPWQSNVYATSSIHSAVSKIYPSTFTFTDRGLYKPGEKVTFRGIDRNLNLGTYLSYKGKYKITIKDGHWNEITPEESENLKGETSENGGFTGSFQLPETAEPGNYSIIYERIDSNIKQKETIPITVSYFERLKFQTSLKMPETILISGDSIQANLGASYLAGGVLASAKYYASWYSEPWYFTTDNISFKDYRFGPLNNNENMKYICNETGTLNGSGKAILNCNTSDFSIKGSPYRYKVSADITDVSNQQISTNAAVVVHPGSYYIGIAKKENTGYLVKSGEEQSFKYKLALPEGTEAASTKNIAKKNAKLKIELLREEWSTVQQQGIHGDVYPRYVKETVTESSDTYNLDTAGEFSITPENVGYYTLRLSSKDIKNRDIVTEYQFFATGSTNNWIMNSSETALKLTPNQNLYNPGDTATILLESPLPKGTYLITVEREGIFTEEVKTFNSSVNTIEVPIARNYVPVCYVSVSSYSVRTEAPNNQYGVADVDKPKGYYGVTPIHINPYVKAFSVDIKTERMAYKPGEEAVINIKATKGGKPLANAEITLMAVDRGVLDLIDYHVPNPIEFFYNESKFPLRVDGGDNRSLLIDPVTYAVKNLAGGDAMMETSFARSGKLNERADFNPTALFEPVIITDENGEATCKFKLPDNLTTYRVTAFGVKDELLALEEDEFVVQNQLNVQQVTPRRLRERDTTEMGVILTNLDSQPQEVKVTLETVSPENLKEEKGITKQIGKAFVDGTNTHNIVVQPGSTASVYFDVAAEKAGIINAEFTINSDILNEKLIYPLTIEKPYIFEQVTSTGAITGSNKEGKEGLIIPSFAEDGLGSISVTLDATRLGPLSPGIKYVFDYPYNCLEAQISRVLPLILFEEYIDIFNTELDEKITDIHSLVVSYFENWSKYQLKDGGFGYWQESKYCNYYVSGRLAHVYALALKQGYTKEELKIDGTKLLNFMYNIILQDKAEEKEENKILSSYERIYLQYIISLLDSGKVTKDDLKLVLENEDSTVSELALGGLTALEINDKKLAEDFKAAINKYLRPNAQSIDITGTSSHWYYSMYNTTVENLALTLQLYTKLDAANPIVTKLVFTLLQNQKLGYWQNTANTSRVFEALYALIKESGLDELDLNATAKLNDKELVKGSFKGVSAKPVKQEYLFSELNLNNKAGTILPLEFTKEGKGDLYFTTTMKYALPYELQIPRDEGLSVVYKLYDDRTGEEITFENKDSSVVKLESGKTYKMDITLSSGKDRTYVALRAPIPSGAEILDATFVTTPPDNSAGSGRSNWSFDNIDDGYYSGSYYMSNETILDNEVQFFWDYFAKGTTTATFKFRAARRGVFPTPPVTAECMYEGEISGRTGGSLYTIE